MIVNSKFYKSVVNKCFERYNETRGSGFECFCAGPSKYYTELNKQICNNDHNQLYKELRLIHKKSIDSSLRKSRNVCKNHLNNYGIKGVFIGNEASLVKAFQAEYVSELSNVHNIEKEIINLGYGLFSVFFV